MRACCICIHELKGLIVFGYDEAFLRIELQARRRGQLNSTVPSWGIHADQSQCITSNLNNSESCWWPAAFSKTKSNLWTFLFVFAVLGKSPERA